MVSRTKLVFLYTLGFPIFIRGVDYIIILIKMFCASVTDVTYSFRIVVGAPLGCLLITSMGFPAYHRICI
nr:MAG TPA: hypothetical protein [Caudoviricetes sp.]